MLLQALGQAGRRRPQQLGGAGYSGRVHGGALLLRRSRRARGHWRAAAALLCRRQLLGQICHLRLVQVHQLARIRRLGLSGGQRLLVCRHRRVHLLLHLSQHARRLDRATQGGKQVFMTV